MKLYLFERQDKDTDIGYDQYAGAIIAATDMQTAKKIMLMTLNEYSWTRCDESTFNKIWEHTIIADVVSSEIKEGLILAEYHAG